jgi:hypothetical protein
MFAYAVISELRRRDSWNQKTHTRIPSGNALYTFTDSGLTLTGEGGPTVVPSNNRATAQRNDPELHASEDVCALSATRAIGAML